MNVGSQSLRAFRLLSGVSRHHLGVAMLVGVVQLTPGHYPA